MAGVAYYMVKSFVPCVGCSERGLSIPPAAVLCCISDGQHYVLYGFHAIACKTQWFNKCFGAKPCADDRSPIALLLIFAKI